MTPTEALERGLHILRAEIVERSTAAGQRATGLTYERLTVEMVNPNKGNLLGPYWVTVWQWGRKPGKVPYDFEAVLQAWAEAKGLHFDSYYMLAKKIREEGTALYNSGDQPDIFDTPIENFERWITEQISEYYTTEITSILNQLGKP